ncbi:hypothetical protein QR680_003531 [Steinernema hermaphroditum]|uniref:RBR-type E3 ubiquitin transferase n=1 Tax=Steinernema hermaphroditum TaxID=289476 RepID=A0AA39LRQ3_9BILA|nr:hypothetical protein QR680_003531 [Steinernema hermaphroditum]
MAGTSETAVESYLDCEKPRLARAPPAKYHSQRRHRQQPDFIRKTIDPWTSFQGIENYVGHLDNERRQPVKALQQDQVGLPEFNVAYSLNKKGRWILPRVMQRDIEAYQDIPNHLRVSLINASDKNPLSTEPEVFHPIKSYHTLLDNEPMHKIAKRGNAKAVDFLRPANPSRHRKGRLLKNPQSTSDLLDDKNYFNSPMEDDLDVWERNAHVVYTTYSLGDKVKNQRIGKISKNEHKYDLDYDLEVDEDFEEEFEESAPVPKEKVYDLEELLVVKHAQKREKKWKNSGDSFDLCSNSSDEIGQDFVYVEKVKDCKPMGMDLPLILENDEVLDLLVLFGEENITYCNGITPITCCVKLTETSAQTLKFMTGTAKKPKEGDVAIVVCNEGQTKIYLNASVSEEAPTTSTALRREHILPSVLSPEKLVYPTASYNAKEGEEVILDAVFSQNKLKSTNLPRDACLQCGSTSIECFSMQCGHLFCRDCARSHALTVEDLPISCPFPECGALFHPTALASFVPLSFVDGYKRKIIEKRLQLPDFLKCYHCRRINHFISDGLNKEGVAICACGAAICRKCEKEAHAPLDCKQMEFYEAILGRKGHTFHTVAPMHDYISEIQAVVCPACGYPVERSYGCNHMTCWCGNEFCYKCGSTYESSGHTCGDTVGRQTFELTDEEVYDFSKRVMGHCNDIRQKKIFRLGGNFFRRYRGRSGINSTTLVSMQSKYTQLFDILERVIVAEYLNGSTARSKHLSSRLEFTLTRIYTIVSSGSRDNVPDVAQLQGLLLESIKLSRNLLSLYQL